jgi:hypothetical protein
VQQLLLHLLLVVGRHGHVPLLCVQQEPLLLPLLLLLLLLALGV